MNNKLQSVIYLAIIFLFANQAWAGELYTCIDKDGNEIISSLDKAGMNCKLKETFQKPTIEEQEREENIERKKTITEREKAKTEQEKAIADQEREKATTARIRKPDALCERECKMDRSSCEDDCRRNTLMNYDRGRYYEYDRNSDRTNCYMNCLNYQKTCIDRCYY